MRRESRYGTWEWRSVSAVTTRASVVRLLLMLLASVNADPDTPLRPTRSLPARSTREMREWRTLVTPDPQPPWASWASTTAVNTLRRGGWVVGWAGGGVG